MTDKQRIGLRQIRALEPGQTIWDPQAKVVCSNHAGRASDFNPRCSAETMNGACARLETGCCTPFSV
jgi:hypothetical protein